jgi:sec-independent protein translocase protein TatB
MFDFSWAELALIAVVALIVIGPKDLPRALRTAGMWARKARTISREFQSSIEQMVREAELDEVKKELEAATSINLETEIKKTVDPDGSLAESLKPPEIVSEPIHSIAAPTPEAAPPQIAAPEAALPEATSSETAPPLPDPETVPAAPSHPSPEQKPHADAEGHATAAPSHSGGTP